MRHIGQLIDASYPWIDLECHRLVEFHRPLIDSDHRFVWDNAVDLGDPLQDANAYLRGFGVASDCLVVIRVKQRFIPCVSTDLIKIAQELT